MDVGGGGWGVGGGGRSHIKRMGVFVVPYSGYKSGFGTSYSVPWGWEVLNRV